MATEVTAADVPVEVWEHHVFPLLNRFDRAALRCAVPAARAVPPAGPRACCPHCSGARSRLSLARSAGAGHRGCIEAQLRRGAEWTGSELRWAARHGQAATICYLRGRGCPWSRRRRDQQRVHRCTSRHRDNDLQAAIRGNHCDALRALRGLGRRWSGGETALAALRGHVEVLHLLRELGCRWSGGEISEAARGGQDAMVLELRRMGRRWDRFETYWAARYGRTSTLGVLLDLKCPKRGNETEAAACGGHNETLVELRRLGFGWSWGTLGAAVRRGHRSTVRLLLRLGCPWQGSETLVAVETRRPAMLRLVRRRGCPWHGKEIATAAVQGDDAMVRQLRRLGCSWGVYDMHGAVHAGHNETIRLLHELGCKWGGQEIEIAAVRGHAETLRVLRQLGCGWPDVATCYYLYTRVSREIRRLFYELGCPCWTKVAGLNALSLLQRRGKTGYTRISDIVREFETNGGEYQVRDVWTIDSLL